MNICIYTPVLEKTLIIDYAESIIFSKNLYDIGTFEVKIPIINSNINDIDVGFFIKAVYSNSDYYIIREIEKVFSNTDGNYIYLRGEELKSLLSYRIIVGQKNLNDTVENNCTNIANYVNDNYAFFYPIRIVSSTHTTTYQLQFDFENVYTAIKTITDTAGFYFDLQFDEDLQRYELLVFGKQDYTDTIFSQSFNNMLSFSEKIDNYNVCNIPVVVGEGSGNSKRYQIVGSIPLQSNDIYCKVDATEISSNSGVISQQEYDNFLINQGIAYKNANKQASTYETQVDTHLYKYKNDFVIGGVVTIINPDTKDRLHALITEITQKWDIDGYVCDLKLEFTNI